MESEQQQRDQLTAAAPEGQPPRFGPMPTLATSTKIVLACETHAISMDLAARVHQATCTAPNAANLPGCDCTPEDLPVSPPNPQVLTKAPQLPEHWQTTH